MDEPKRQSPITRIGILLVIAVVLVDAFAINRCASRSRAYLETVERHCTNNDFEALSSFLEKPRKVFSSAEASGLPAEYQEIVKSKGLSATDVGYWFSLPTTPFRHLLIATDAEGKIKWWVVHRA